jgi:hypothetical protein
MKLPVQITFRNIPPSEVIETWIRAEVEKLETFYERPIGCRVAVEMPHRHHRKGSPYHIRVEITLPGGEIVVSRRPTVGKRLRQTGESTIRKQLESDREYKNLRLAVNETFRAAARRLSAYAQRQRGEVKTHRLRLRPYKTQRTSNDGLSATRVVGDT